MKQHSKNTGKRSIQNNNKNCLRCGFKKIEDQLSRIVSPGDMNVINVKSKIILAKFTFHHHSPQQYIRQQWLSYYLYPVTINEHANQFDYHTLLQRPIVSAQVNGVILNMFADSVDMVSLISSWNVITFYPNVLLQPSNTNLIPWDGESLQGQAEFKARLETNDNIHNDQFILYHPKI